MKAGKDRGVVHIVLAYLYHAIMILMGFLLMRHYVDAMLTVALVGEILYLGYWILWNRKAYMPWTIYFHFLVGSAIEAALNLFGVIPEDGGWFAGLGQGIYVFFLLCYAALIGLANGILWLIARIREKRRDTSSETGV